MHYKQIAAQAVQSRADGWDKIVGICLARSQEYCDFLEMQRSDVERIARFTADNYPDLHEFERVREASFFAVGPVVFYARYLSSRHGYEPVVLACHTEPEFWNKGKGPERFMHVSDREHVSLLDALRAEE